MGEDSTERAGSYLVSRTVEYYETFVMWRGATGEKSPETLAAQANYKAIYDSLSPEEQSEVQDKLIALFRPDLAEKEVQPEPEPLDPNDPAIKGLAQQVDKRLKPKEE